MPIYEYECTKCGEISEALQGFNDKPLKRCKTCRGKLERIVSLSSFHLKGNGWYSTDYAKNAGIPPRAEAQDNPAISESTNGTKTSADVDKKPALEPKPAVEPKPASSSRRIIQKGGVQRSE